MVMFGLSLDNDSFQSDTGMFHADEKKEIAYDINSYPPHAFGLHRAVAILNLL